MGDSAFMPFHSSLLNFVQVEHVPPACRHVAHRLLIRLLCCAMVLQKSGRDGRNLPGFRDQFTKLEEYVPMLSEEMKAFVEHDLRLSMKVLDGMRTIGAIERADIEEKNTKRVENWIDARLVKSQRRQLAKEARSLPVKRIILLTSYPRQIFQHTHNSN